jgi:glycosyl transferase, family 25
VDTLTNPHLSVISSRGGEDMTWPILIIALEGSEHRREFLEKILSAMNAEFRIFKAVDARSGVPAEFQRNVDHSAIRVNMGRDLSSAEIGCALSHNLLAHKVIENDWPGAIVLEEDAIIAEGDLFMEFLSKEIYKRYDFLHLGYGPARVWRWTMGRRKETRGLSTEMLVHNAALTTSYTISHKAAQFLAAANMPIKSSADWPCDLGPLRPRVVVPRLVGRPPQHAMSEIHRFRETVKKVVHSATPPKRNPKPAFYPYFHRIFSRTII